MLDLRGWGRVSAVVVQVRRNLKGPRQGKEGKSRGFCICAAKRLIIDVGTVRRWLVQGKVTSSEEEKRLSIRYEIAMK